MGGFSFEVLVPGDGVDEGLHGGDGAGRDKVEVRALGEEPPDMAVDVLDRALLPRGAGVGVVNLQGFIDGLEEAFEGADADEPSQSLSHGPGGEGGQSALPVDTRDEGVHLPVSERGPLGDLGGCSSMERLARPFLARLTGGLGFFVLRRGGRGFVRAGCRCGRGRCGGRWH